LREGKAATVALLRREERGHARMLPERLSARVKAPCTVLERAVERAFSGRFLGVQGGFFCGHCPQPSACVADSARVTGAYLAATLERGAS
jgi:hypothetical protein